MSKVIGNNADLKVTWSFLSIRFACVQGKLLSGLSSLLNTCLVQHLYSSIKYRPWDWPLFSESTPLPSAQKKATGWQADRHLKLGLAMEKRGS